MKWKHIGSTVDSLFEELRERDEVELLTLKKLLAAPWRWRRRPKALKVRLLQVA